MRRNLISVTRLQQRSIVLRATYATNSRRPGQGDASDAVPDPSHNDVGPGMSITFLHCYSFPLALAFLFISVHDIYAQCTATGITQTLTEAIHRQETYDRQGAIRCPIISETDTGNNNKRAHEDHPAAPGPVIGMNDERGGKGL
jgi:hypothetical protein